MIMSQALIMVINLTNILLLYFERIKQLLTCRSYDLLWIEKELLPFFPAWLEKILIQNIPYAVDYDDAQFHIYDHSKSKLVKLFLSQKIDRIMANSALTIAGNKYIAARANQAGAKRVEILPTVVDLDRYSLKTVTTNHQSFTIGWIGSPITCRYLKTVQPVFENLTEKYNCTFTLVGAGNLQMGNVDLDIRKWEESAEVEDIKTFDVGIMPLVNTPWEEGKCGIKLIQYMACGLPVVGTPIGVNQEIINHGVNGFHANNLDEWTEYLSKLAENQQLRHQMGAEGRLMVESKYSLQLAAPKLSELLKSCI
jgi:glycosyltransferase involved in cell wall biosynthesis